MSVLLLVIRKLKAINVRNGFIQSNKSLNALNEGDNILCILWESNGLEFVGATIYEMGETETGTKWNNQVENMIKYSCFINF